MTTSKTLRDTFVGEKRFVNYKIITKGGRKTKIPYTTNNTPASSTDPETWSTYDEVTVALDNGSNHFDGYGIIFKPDQKLVGIDIDHCIKDSKITHEQKKIIEKLIKEADTYTEISPSGEGIHLFLLIVDGETGYEPTMHKKAPYEVYTKGRYFTVTENSLGTSKVVRKVTNDEVNRLLSIIGMVKEEKKQDLLPVNSSSVLDDKKLLNKMFSSKNGGDIKALYNGDISKYKGDDSSADMALCMQLAFWTRKDSAQMESIWLASPLGQRAKTQERKDYVERTITSAINECNNVYEQTEAKTPESKERLILKDICNREDVVLFHDEKGETYISLENSGHREIWSLKSKIIKRFLNKKSWDDYKTLLKSDAIKNIIATLEGEAHFSGPEIKLHNRVFWDNETLYYDLTNESFQAVKINKDGWEVLDKTPIIFKRYTHHKAQVTPTRNGDIKLLFNYVNIDNKEHQLLYSVLLVSNFIPNFPHPIMTFFGAQGASKSTSSKVSRLTLDPSVMDASGLSSNQKELIQELAHHYFTIFDNVSHIPPEVSDILCKAISGGSFSKRELYSDDEDIIYKIQVCIGINGINLVVNRPDLLDRCILLELQRLKDSERKAEGELYAGFEKDLPNILGGIFDVLAEAIKRRPDIVVKPERMADFTYWGCAIAEAMGYTKEEFLLAYKKNIAKQTEMLLNDNIVATAIITFMEDKDEWKNTPTKLLDELYNHAFFTNIDTREKYWPKGATALSRRLNELSTSLKQMGISIIISTSGTERYIHIQKIKNSSEQLTRETSEVEQLSLTNDTDGTDDVLETLL